MNLKMMLLGMGAVLIVGLGILFYSMSEKEGPAEPTEPENEEEVARNLIPEFDKDGKLKPTEIMGDEYTEENRLELVETTNEKLTALNAELKKVKEEYNIEVNVFQGEPTANKEEEKVENGEMLNFVVVLENNSDKDFKQTFDFPCEYFLSIFEDENFVSMREMCEKTEDQELVVKAGETFHFVLGKLFVEDEKKGKERKVFVETPFGIYESAVTLK